MPISIVDLGIVERVSLDTNPDRDHAVNVSISIIPTFIGCPALDMIHDEVTKAVGALDGVGSVSVEFINDPPWSVDRISEAGRESLRVHGVTAPPQGVTGIRATTLRTSAIPCPFCGSTHTHLDSPFGPTRCRSIYYCESCRNTFEHMKRV